MDGAAVGDFGKAGFLFIVQVTLEADFAFDDVYFDVGFAFAIFAVAGENLFMGKAHGDVFYGPLLASSI